MTTQPTLTGTRDIVVIGCSAGGVEALPRVLQQLPSSLEAAIFIVQHLGPSSPLHLATILARTARLPVVWAEQGAAIEHGRVMVCPPDVHMLLSERHVQLSRGARENYARPAIDKLFRSAAAVFGSRAIGVLLTGMLGDGVAGLRAIHDAGGITIVQDPGDAQFPELPSRALLVVTPDRTLPIDAIGGAIASIVRERVAVSVVPRELALEAEIDREGQTSAEELAQLGPQTSVTCPECHGPLWQLGDEELRRYRCYLGHVTTASELIAASAIEVETSLWSAVRALNDRAITLETLADDARRVGNRQSADGFAIRAREARKHADVARQFMLDLGRAK
jgi:two-component system, chemotaxis family, protein-glutamate methylesterase/glutaminase